MLLKTFLSCTVSPHEIAYMLREVIDLNSNKQLYTFILAVASSKCILINSSGSDYAPFRPGSKNCIACPFSSESYENNCFFNREFIEGYRTIHSITIPEHDRLEGCHILRTASYKMSKFINLFNNNPDYKGWLVYKLMKRLIEWDEGMTAEDKNLMGVYPKNSLVANHVNSLNDYECLKFLDLFNSIIHKSLGPENIINNLLYNFVYEEDPRLSIIHAMILIGLRKINPSLTYSFPPPLDFVSSCDKCPFYHELDKTDITNSDCELSRVRSEAMRKNMFFCPHTFPDGVLKFLGSSIHEVLFYNLLEPAESTKSSSNLNYLREVARELLAESRAKLDNKT